MGSFFAAVGSRILQYAAYAIDLARGMSIATGLTIAQGVYAHKTAMKAKRKGADILLQKYGTGQGMPIIYGSRRIGSTVVYMETKNNKELFVVYALAGHELDSFDLNSIQLDGRIINDDEIYRQGYDLSDGTTRIKYRNGSATITSGTYWGNTSAERANITGGANDGDNARMTFNLHHGTTSQAADPMLSGILDNWTSNHKLTGIAYIAANYEYDTKGMFSGIPNLSIVVKGKKVYDPRKDTAHGGTGSHDFDTITTYEWSDNAALCLLDYITNDEYGKGLGEADIDMSSFQTAATDAEATVDTISHTITVNSASIDSDVLVIASTSETEFKKLKIGNFYTVTAGATTHIDNRKLLSKDYGETGLVGGNRRPVYRLSFESGAVDAAITTATSCTFTETEKRFHCNGVIDTDESVIDNTKLLISNMRGIFTYSNGKYSIDVEGTETPVQTLTEDHILDAGIQLNLESKEQKYNKVEIEFFNSQKKYETDTAYYTGESSDTFLADDGNEILETRVQFPFVTNQRIAYNHAVAILKRSRSQRTISFLCSPRVLKSRVGEVIAITNSNLDLSAEQYRITNMTIQPDLNIEVTAIEYQGGIYGYNEPPDEDLGIIKDPVESNRVEAPSNFNFNQKSGSTPAYLSWDDGNTYPSYEFAVKVYDSTNQSGTVIRDGRVKETRFYLPQLAKANGYSALVVAINSLGIESEDTLLNSFNVTIDPVVNVDIADNAVDTEEINQGAIGGMQFTETKAYYGTGTFNNSNTPFYVDTSSNFSLGSALSFNGTTLTIGGYATDTDIADFITGAEVNANVTSISGGVIQTGTILADRMNVSTISSISADLGSITAGSINIGSGAFTVSSSGVMTATGATVSGNITATTLNVSGATVTGTLDAEVITLNGTPLDDIFAHNSGTGETTITGSESLTGNLSVGGNLTVTGNVETTGHHNKLVFGAYGKGLKFGDSSILYEWTETTTGTEDAWFGHSNASALIGLSGSKPAFFDGSNFNGIAYKNATSGYVVVGTDVDLKFDSIGVGTAASGTTGEIRATNNITAYYSDARLKDFEGVIPNALEKLSAINGYYFKENDKAKELGYNNPNRQVGVSAQEILDIMPEAVTEAPIDKKYLAVQYDKLVPLLIQAIKELKQEVEELKQ